MLVRRMAVDLEVALVLTDAAICNIIIMVIVSVVRYADVVDSKACTVTCIRMISMPSSAGKVWTVRVHDL